MFVRTKKRGQRTYLLVVENQRINGQVRQVVLHRLGRLDVLQQSGQLDGMLASLGRFSEKLAVLGAHQQGESVSSRSRTIGPALIFERLWRELGIHPVLQELLRSRKFEFAVERAVFLTVLHRMFDSGSDRRAEKWKADYAIAGTEALELHHLYRAMAYLGTPLPRQGQEGRTPFAPRCVKDEIEEAFFELRRDLFRSVNLVFFDTTSIYFEGAGGESIGQQGFSKDYRPDLKQLVVGVVLDDQGRPIGSELWPGNTADVKSLVPIVDRLRKRFSVGEICIVADRGMISQETIQELEKSERKWKYILGVRMRRQKEVREEVLGRAGRYQEVYPARQNSKDPSPLKVKEVRVEDRRYVVCLNEDQAEKDRQDRQAIVAALEDALKAGDKSLIGNKGFRRYVKTEGARFQIDPEKIEAEARYDGKWVLTTNLDLSARDIALKYKQLWTVEAMFRSMKSLLETRPIFHKCDETIRGHVFCSFLALVLRKELQDRLENKGWRLEWDDIIRDLDHLLETEISVQGKGYIIRSESKGTIGKVAQACKIALPPALRAV
ncbi:MAG TPA: IS1634 family transposase [bacterium]|nr:IS1634 family transposase [bacterium]